MISGTDKQKEGGLLINADLFKKTFGIYATDIWSRPEGEFLDWLNAEAPEPDIKPDELSDKTKAWLDTMSAEERLETIAGICVDWDGYRTEKGLGSLINEIWAYALYSVNNGSKEKVKGVQPMDIDEFIEMMGVILYGKERFFKQSNSLWYDRDYCDYVDQGTVLGRIYKQCSEEMDW